MSSEPPDASEAKQQPLDTSGQPHTTHLPGGEPSTAPNPLSQLAPPATPQSKIFSVLPDSEAPPSRDALDESLRRLRTLRDNIGTFTEMRSAAYQILSAYIGLLQSPSGSDPIEALSLFLTTHYPPAFTIQFLRCATDNAGDQAADSLVRLIWAARHDEHPNDEPPPLDFEPPPASSGYSKPPDPLDALGDLTTGLAHVKLLNPSLLDSPPTFDVASTPNVFQSTHIPRSTGVEALLEKSVQQTDNLATALALSAPRYSESFAQEIHVVPFYTEAQPSGYDASLFPNFGLQELVDVTPLSSAEQLQSPLLTSVLFTKFVQTFIESPAAFSQARHLLHKELAQRYIQVYCHSRTGHLSVARAGERATVTVHGFIFPIFTSFPSTHTLALRSQRKLGSTHVSQLVALLTGLDVLLRPTEDVGALTWWHLRVLIGETLLQFLVRADTAATDTGQDISTQAYHRRVRSCFTEILTESPVACVARDLMITTFPTSDGTDLIAGIKPLSCSSEVLLLQGGGPVRPGAAFPTDAVPPEAPVIAPTPTRKPKIDAVNLVVMKPHSQAGRRAVSVPPPQLILQESDCWICIDLDTRRVKWIAGAKANPPGTRFHHNPWRCPDQEKWWAAYSKAFPNDKREDIMPKIDNEFDVYVAACRSAGIEIVGNVANRTSRG
jgi:hypothetical protein